MNDERAKIERNIREFLEKHGQEGFLKLFLTNYLYDLVLYFVHSAGRDREENPGYYFYFRADGKVIAAEEVDELREEVRKECSRRATYIVSEMKKRGILQQAIQDPVETSPELFKLVQQTLEEMIRRR